MRQRRGFVGLRSTLRVAVSFAQPEYILRKQKFGAAQSRKSFSALGDSTTQSTAQSGGVHNATDDSQSTTMKSSPRPPDKECAPRSALPPHAARGRARPRARPHARRQDGSGPRVEGVEAPSASGQWRRAAALSGEVRGRELCSAPELRAVRPPNFVRPPNCDVRPPNTNFVRPPSS